MVCLVVTENNPGLSVCFNRNTVGFFLSMTVLYRAGFANNETKENPSRDTWGTNLGSTDVNLGKTGHPPQVTQFCNTQSTTDYHQVQGKPYSLMQ